MKKWRVLINGTNFKMEMQEDGRATRVRRMGFFTNVFVVARTSRDAELQAVAALQQDQSLRKGLRNTKDDPPVLFAGEIQEIRSFRGCRRPRMGLVLYGERGPRRKK